MLFIASCWACRAFGCVIFDEVISKWSKSGKRHLIGQMETWRELLLKFEQADFDGPCIGWFTRLRAM